LVKYKLQKNQHFGLSYPTSGVEKMRSKVRTKIIDQSEEDALQNKRKKKTLLKHVTF